MAWLSINGVLGGVEVLDACFGDAVPAPELVSFGAVLGVAVGDYVSAVAAADYEDLPQLMVRKLFLVSLDIHVTRFENHVTTFTVVDRVKDCSIALV